MSLDSSNGDRIGARCNPSSGHRRFREGILASWRQSSFRSPSTSRTGHPPPPTISSSCAGSSPCTITSEGNPDGLPPSLREPSMVARIERIGRVGGRESRTRTWRGRFASGTRSRPRCERTWGSLGTRRRSSSSTRRRADRPTGLLRLRRRQPDPRGRHRGPRCDRADPGNGLPRRAGRALGAIPHLPRPGMLPRSSSTARRTRAASGARCPRAGTGPRFERSASGRQRSDDARARAPRSGWRAGRSLADPDLPRIRGALPHRPRRGEPNARLHGPGSGRAPAPGACIGGAPTERPRAGRGARPADPGRRSSARSSKAPRTSCDSTRTSRRSISEHRSDPDLAWAATRRGPDAPLPHRVRGRGENGMHDELRVERHGPDGRRPRHPPRRPRDRRRRAALERVPHAERDGRRSRVLLSRGRCGPATAGPT